jgi:hypothetical protein
VTTQPPRHPSSSPSRAPPPLICTPLCDSAKNCQKSLFQIFPLEKQGWMRTQG